MSCEPRRAATPPAAIPNAARQMMPSKAIFGSLKREKKSPLFLRRISVPQGQGEEVMYKRRTHMYYKYREYLSPPKKHPHISMYKMKKTEL